MLVLSLCTSFKALQNQHGVYDKKRDPNKNHRVQKVKNMVHKIQHGVYDTTGPYKHRAVLIWQVRVGYPGSSIC